MLRSRDVVFDELRNYSDFNSDKINSDDYKPEYLLPDLRLSEVENVNHIPEVENDEQPVVNNSDLNDVSENITDPVICDNDSVIYNRPQRHRTVPVRYGWEQASAAISSDDP